MTLPAPGVTRPRSLILSRAAGKGKTGQTWIGLPVTAIAASFIASEWVGWAWQV